MKTRNQMFIYSEFSIESPKDESLDTAVRVSCFFDRRVVVDEEFFTNDFFFASSSVPFESFVVVFATVQGNTSTFVEYSSQDSVNEPLSRVSC